MDGETIRIEVSPEELRQLTQNGTIVISGVRLSYQRIGPFVTVEDRVKERWPMATKRHHRRIRDVCLGMYRERVGRDPYKSTGHINYNHAAFVDVSRAYFSDALTVMRTQPSAYRASVARAWGFYFMSGTDNSLGEGNLVPVRRWISWWDSVVFLRWPGTSACLSLIVGLPLAAVYAVWRSRRHTAWAFIALMIWYIAVVGNATEVGENNRFRFATDALSVAALAAVGQAVARRLRPRRALS